VEGREKGTRGLAGNIVEGVRTLLAPLPERIPNRGRWGGSFPVVPGRSATLLRCAHPSAGCLASLGSPPANLFRASGSLASIQQLERMRFRGAYIAAFKELHSA